MRAPFPTIHGCALIVGDAGLLIRGASGSGKSSLTLALLEQAQAQGRFARLVADDRVGLTLNAGQLIAAPHPVIAGQIEKRGIGILSLPHQSAVKLTHVIDLLPETQSAAPQMGRITIQGVELGHFEIPAGAPLKAATQALLAKI